MPKVNCAVDGCVNSTYKLNKWKNEECDSQDGLKKKDCQCWERPFALYCFPSLWNNRIQREQWISALKRQNQNKTPLKPTDSDRICSEHFVDGIPTGENPVPTCLLCFENKQKTRRKLVVRKPFVGEKRTFSVIDEDHIDNIWKLLILHGES